VKHPLDRGPWSLLEREVVSCERCARLVEHRREVARSRRRAYRDQVYWGRPVPGFGEPDARILVLGLAPAAHGANRTGRMFTGDGSGDWLFRALHRAELSSHGESVSADDGMRLRGVFVTAVCRCAPPANRPSPGEVRSCSSFLDREIELLPELRVVLALGRIAWDAVLRRAARAAPGSLPRPRPQFGHGARTRLVLRAAAEPLWLLGSYHPSRQNTQTGRLSRAMLDGVVRRAARLAGAPPMAR